jgi:quercetin dioxygenase-like cupin family protein
VAAAFNGALNCQSEPALAALVNVRYYWRSGSAPRKGGWHVCLLHEVTEFHKSGRQSSVVLHKGEGDTAVYPGRAKTTFKLTAKDSEGHYGLYECEIAPGAITPPHIHYVLSEQFYVLEGELELLVGEERIKGRPGSFVSVPKGMVHAFGNITDRPVTFLLLFCPEINRERYFSRIAEFMQSGNPNWKDLKEALDLEFDSYDPEPRVKFP